MEEIIKSVSKAIKSCGKTYVELSEITGIPRSTIQRYAVGEVKKMPIHNLKKLAGAMGMSPEALMGLKVAENENRGLRQVSLRRIPLLGSIGAGDPRQAIEEYDDFIDTFSDADFALTVDGDSMQPTINRGDLALIRIQPDVVDGQIAAVLLDNSAVIKRVTHVPGGIVIISDNPSYPPRMITAGEYDTVKILGRVIQTVHTF